MIWKGIQQCAVVRRIVPPNLPGLPHCEVSESANDLAQRRRSRKSQHMFHVDQREPSLMDADQVALVHLIVNELETEDLNKPGSRAAGVGWRNEVAENKRNINVRRFKELQVEHYF